VEVESPDMSTFKRRRCFTPDTISESPMSLNKRRREGDDGESRFQNDQLRHDIEIMKEQALAKIREVELINQNLKLACEEQQKELVHKNNENKMLKRSLLTLNSKREELVTETKNAAYIINQQQEKIRQLEQSVYSFCVQMQQGGGCRKDDFSGHNGGGPVF